MTRLSDEINQGLRIKDALYEKIERISVALIKELETYIYSVRDFKSLKSSAHHFIDGGWSGTSKAIFIFSDGWTLEFTSGYQVYLKNDKLLFLVGSGEYQGGGIFNPPTLFKYPNTVAKLYEFDRSLDQMLLDIYNQFTVLQPWFDDLKVRS